MPFYFTTDSFHVGNDDDPAIATEHAAVTANPGVPGTPVVIQKEFPVGTPTGPGLSYLDTERQSLSDQLSAAVTEYDAGDSGQNPTEWEVLSSGKLVNLDRAGSQITLTIGVDTQTYAIDTVRALVSGL